jgi:DGQHR domain-containing protein
MMPMAMKIPNAAPSFNEYHALRGSYGKVSYFVTKTTLRDVAENLVLAPAKTLSFTERIQREINVKRVETEILPYLRQNDLRFFNALVCVLLPDDDTSRGFWAFEDYTDDNGHQLGGLGKLKITKQVGRVVLDGQHRFLALKKFWDQVRLEPDSADAQIEVALIFVVVDDLGRIDLKETKLRTRTIAVARNLFAVLNKTARSVDKTTLLLIDDTDIANVMTRRIIEEKLVDDRLIKWTKASNLNPADPYFTVIHVLRDGIEHYLRDQRDFLDHDYGVEEERNEALKTLYLKTPKTNLAIREAIPEMITKSAPYVEWGSLLKKTKIHVLHQPDETPLGKMEKRPLAKARGEQLAFTVAGQKAYYRAIIDCFYAQPGLDKAAMEVAIHRAALIFQKGLFRRDPKKDNPFLGVLFDSKGRMFFSESAVDCGRQILGIAIGSSSNRDAVLSEYKVLANLETDPVEKFWKDTTALRRQ